MARLTEEDKRKIFKQGVLPIALRALRKAKRKAPVDTGRLRASITVADSEGLVQDIGGAARTGDEVDPPRQEYVARIGTNVEYAAFVEFGTVHMEAQPYLRPAVDEAVAEASR